MWIIYRKCMHIFILVVSLYDMDISILREMKESKNKKKIIFKKKKKNKKKKKIFFFFFLIMLIIFFLGYPE